MKVAVVLSLCLIVILPHSDDDAHWNDDHHNMCKSAGNGITEDMCKKLEKCIHDAILPRPAQGSDTIAHRHRHIQDDDHQLRNTQWIHYFSDHLSLNIDTPSIQPQHLISTISMSDRSDSYYPPSLAIAMLCVSLFGMFGNALIIIATWLTKSLHQRCNVLIAIMAFVDLIAGVYFVQLRVIILAGGLFWTNQKCFLWSIHGLLTINIQSGLGLALGVDRLLAIVQPIRYQVWNSKKYLFLMLLPVFAYAIGIVGYGYSQSTNNESLSAPVCSPANVYKPKAALAFLLSNLVIVVLIVLVYGTAQYKIRNKTNVSFGSEERVATMKHLLSSLSYVMIVYSTCWALEFVALLILQVQPPQSPVGRIIFLHAAWLVIIYASFNVVFYAWRSQEYRNAFVKTLTFGRYYYNSGIKKKNVVSVLVNRNTQ